MNAEFERFMRLHEQHVAHTLDYVKQIPESAWAAIPVDTETLFLGSRVNKITLGALIRHLIVAELHWFELLTKAEDGDTLPVPRNAALLDDVADGNDLLAAYQDAWQQSSEYLRIIGEGDLERKIRFVEREYTVQSFLWAIMSHHGFHMGQIDLQLRQLNNMPPEFMEWSEKQRVL